MFVSRLYRVISSFVINNPRITNCLKSRTKIRAEWKMDVNFISLHVGCYNFAVESCNKIQLISKGEERFNGGIHALKKLSYSRLKERWCLGQVLRYVC